VRWSKHLSRTEPLLVFASDVDAASEYAADADGEFEQVVVDATEQNSQRLASLKYLRRATKNLVVVTNERSVAELLAEEDSVWEWTDQDFRGLVWPADSSSPTNGMLRANASRLRRNAASRPKIRQVSLPQAADALAAHRQLQQSARERGDDSLATLDESVAVGFRWLSLNLRCCYVPSSNGDWERAVSQYDSAITDLVRGTAFLTDVERDAIAAMQSRLRVFDASIREGNPKAAAVSEELGQRRGVKLYFLDSRLTREASQAYAEWCVVTTPDTNSAENGAVVAGWYNRRRMEKLLCPAFTDPLVLVLYDCEYRWWAGFEREREQAREQRRASSDRSKVFPQVRGWRPQAAPSAASRPDVGGEPVHTSAADDEDQWGVFAGYLLREHAPTVSEDSVPARLVSFTDGSYGLFTESYKLNTVTRLLDTPGEENVKLERLEVARLEEGDAVLFSTSGQDAIKEVADTLLPSGIRVVAALWRDALVAYCKSTNNEPEKLRESLHAAGCEVHTQTVTNWLRDEDQIGPQKYIQHIPAIAKATRDQALSARLTEVVEAVGTIRSAHLQAGALLAKRVRDEALELLAGDKKSLDEDTPASFDIVRIEEVALHEVDVRRSSVNRLIRGEPWLV
jgi:hypothetical protein